MALVAPGFFAPLFDERASVLGLPAGVPLTVVLALLAGLGILALRRGGLGDRRIRLLAAAWLAVPLPVILLFLGGAGNALVYALLAALLLAAASVRWLSFAAVVPYVLWLLFGPAFILFVVNLA
jgi:hypothetical protein